MLKPSRITINLPAPLTRLVQKRVDEEGYGSASEYFVALAAYDLLLRREHRITASLMRRPRAFRDAIFTDIARNFDQGESPTRPGSWLEHRLEELVQERLGPATA